MRVDSIRAWAEAVEFGSPPPVQPPFDEFGNPLPVFSTTGIDHQDARLCQSYSKKRDTEFEHLQKPTKHLKILLRNGAVKEVLRRPKLVGRDGCGDASNQSFPYETILVPARISGNDASILDKPVPTHFQAALLLNGEASCKLERMPTYAQRVRDLGYPDKLCPLPITEVEPKGPDNYPPSDAKVDEPLINFEESQLKSELKVPGYCDNLRQVKSLHAMSLIAAEESKSSEGARSSKIAVGTKGKRQGPLFSYMAPENMEVTKPTATSTCGSPPKRTRFIENLHLEITEPPPEKTFARRPRAASDLSRSNAIRRPSNTYVEDKADVLCP